MFVTFEGPEGAGKSTLLQMVSLRLQSSGYEVFCTREPGAGKVGSKIRSLLLHDEDIPAATELFLFLADRSNHVAKIIRPNLEAGKVVLCDRFADSTWVYQSYARGLDSDFVNACNEFATAGLRPNLTLLLDLPSEVGLARLANPDRIDAEPIEFHHRVRAGFLNLAAEESHRIKIIDARQDPSVVEERCLEFVLTLLEKAQVSRDFPV